MPSSLPSIPNIKTNFYSVLEKLKVEVTQVKEKNNCGKQERLLGDVYCTAGGLKIW